MLAHMHAQTHTQRLEHSLKWIVLSVQVEERLALVLEGIREALRWADGSRWFVSLPSYSHWPPCGGRGGGALLVLDHPPPPPALHLSWLTFRYASLNPDLAPPLFPQSFMSSIAFFFFFILYTILNKNYWGCRNYLVRVFNFYQTVIWRPTGSLGIKMLRARHSCALLISLSIYSVLADRHTFMKYCV